ncbi:MAG: hypothetical protein ABI231_11835 [Candidatus Tumulicola sp.]
MPGAAGFWPINRYETYAVSIWSYPFVLSFNPKISTLAFALALASLAPLAAAASMVDAAQIPDGTYTVKVEKVLDAKHVVVFLDNGSETTLGAGRDSVDFSKVQQNDQIKLSLIKGTVMVYADLTSH